MSEPGKPCMTAGYDNGTITNPVALHTPSVVKNPRSGRRVFKKMLARWLLPSCREFIVILLLSFAAATLLGGTRLKTRKAPHPKAFFSEVSLVHDFPTGNLDAAFSAASGSLYTLVFYYAPWDHNSRAVRPVLESVARVFFDQVTFVAVNCWQPDGGCRNRFSKIPFYPIIVMHVHDYKGIVYRGPLTSTYIGRFIAESVKRVTRIDSANEAASVLRTKDALVLGNFDVKGPAVDPSLPPAYHLFYSAALRALERDPAGDVAFAVVVNSQVASELGLKDQGIAVLTWHDTEVYPSFSNFTHPGEVEKLLDWVFNTAMRSVEWVTSSGSSPHRGQALAKFLADGPTLVLFTPRNLWLPVSPFYQLLLQVSVEYLNCDDVAEVDEFTNRLASVRRSEPLVVKAMMENCAANTVESQDMRLPRAPTINCPQRLSASAEFPNDTQNCCSCFSPLEFVICDACTLGKSSCDFLNRLSSFKHVLRIEEADERCWASYGTTVSLCCCKQPTNASQDGLEDTFPAVGMISSTSPGPLIDDRVLAAIRQDKELKCRMFVAATELQNGTWEFPASDSPAGGKMDAVRGLRCDTSRSRHDQTTKSARPLNFIAIDSRVHPEFGLKFGKEDNESFAVIIDVHEESHFVLEKKVSEKSLVQFVKNFSAGLLSRSKFSSDILNGDQARTACQGQQASDACVRVTDLNAADFHDVVTGRQQDLVLFFTAPWCGFCAAASHVFLMVARLFEALQAEVKFALVNGDGNTLPWEYDMPSFPTILYLPLNRKKDSRIFPSEHMPLDSENLLKFVLANVPVKVRWKFAAKDCDERCAARMRVAIRSRIKTLLALYRAALRDGMRSRPELRSLMSQLQHYRGMYWAFTDPDAELRS